MHRACKNVFALNEGECIDVTINCRCQSTRFGNHFFQYVQIPADNCQYLFLAHAF